MSLSQQSSARSRYTSNAAISWTRGQSQPPIVGEEKITVIAHFQQVSHTSAKLAGVIISLNSGTDGKGVDKLPLKPPAGYRLESYCVRRLGSDFGMQVLTAQMSGQKKLWVVPTSSEGRSTVDVPVGIVVIEQATDADGDNSTWNNGCLVRSRQLATNRMGNTWTRFEEGRSNFG